MTPVGSTSRPARVGHRLRAVPARHKVTVAVIVLIAAQLALRGFFVSRGWYLLDDYFFLADVAEDLHDFGWYTRLHQGHFMPFSFMLVHIVSLFGAFNWSAVAIQILLLQAVASLSCWWMLRTVFGHRKAILPAFAIYLFSPLTMPTVMWWAVAINQLPHQIAVFGAIAAHVTFLRTRRWSAVALTAAFMALGFASYSKTLLLPVVLLIITVAYFSTGSARQRMWFAARTYWQAWLVLGSLTVVFVIGYLAASPPSTGTAQGSLLALTERATLESFATPLVGGPWEWRVFGDGPISYTAAPEIGIIVAWLLIAAVVVWAWATREHALRALWLPVTYLAASILLVYTGRALVLMLLGGSYVGQHLQYLSDMAPIIAFSVAAMFVPIPGASESARKRRDPLITLRLHPALPIALGTTVLAGSVVSSVGYAQPYADQNGTRDFTIEAAEIITTQKPHVADVLLPEKVMNPIVGDHALVRSYFAPLGSSLRISTLGNDLQIFRDDASIAYAKVATPARTRRDPTLPCPYPVKGSTEIPFTTVLDYPMWLSIEYVADSAATIPLVFGKRRVMVPIQEGRHTLFVKTSAEYDSIRLWPLQDQEICVSAVRAGDLVAQGGS